MPLLGKDRPMDWRSSQIVDRALPRRDANVVHTECDNNLAAAANSRKNDAQRFVGKKKSTFA